MKIKKTAKQKNFTIDRDRYSDMDIVAMQKKRIIFRCNEADVFRIDTSICKEVKVIVDDSGYYATVVITVNNEMFYINI